MLVCPESPRWLARKDRWEEAEKVLLHLRNLPSDHPYIHDELSDIRQQVEQHTANKMSYRKMFKRLIQKGVRNRVLTGLLLMACQNMTGVNIITYCKLLLAVFYEPHWLTGSQTLPAFSRRWESRAPAPSSLLLASTALPRHWAW